MFESRKIVKFIALALIYILWVVWMDSYIWLLGLIVIFDSNITEKVNWTFWKKRGVERHSKFVEWLDAVIFAVVAAIIIRLFIVEAYTIPTSSMEKSMLVGDYLFVSKSSYGPKMPNTPLAVPFVHHTMPLTAGTPAYSTAIQKPYKRLAGFTEIKRGDVIVFNFPEGDTVVSKLMDANYYSIVRELGGRERIESGEFGEILYRPVDKRENYIKRCIAIAGDSIYIDSGKVYVNGSEYVAPAGVQFNYQIITNGTAINPRVFSNLDITPTDISFNGSIYQMPLTEELAGKLRAIKSIKSVTRIRYNGADENIFPSDSQYSWNVDNFGPLWIPKAGSEIVLTVENLPLYRRVISVYEGNDLEVRGGDIYINGAIANSYTFKMNYYWAMGDNRHNSADSRYWGFVPEDHMVGKASFIWLSIDKYKTFPNNIRWDRLFSIIE